MNDLELTELVDAINMKYKFIGTKHKDYDKVICYVIEKTKEGMKKFNPNNKANVSIKPYTITLIRCYFHEAKQKIQKDIDIKQGNCDNCVVKKMLP